MAVGTQITTISTERMKKMIADSGVKGYMLGTTTVSMGFPIDHKGGYHIACKYCRFLISSRRCVITDELVPFPESHVGSQCPFEFKEIDYTKEDK